MNFLAHLWLADVTGTSVPGALLGDVLHGPIPAQWPAPLRLGIRIHRRVDVVTDHHPLSRGWRQRFPPQQRRHATILLDLLCDHALALDWADYSAEPLADFSRRVAVEVAAQAPWFERAGGRPPDPQRLAALLQSYRHRTGLRQAIARTAARLRRPQPLLIVGEPICWAPVWPLVRRDLPELMQTLTAAARAIQFEEAPPAPAHSPPCSSSSMR